jgi:hypothetical protein
MRDFNPSNNTKLSTGSQPICVMVVSFARLYNKASGTLTRVTGRHCLSALAPTCQRILRRSHGT